MAGDTVAVVGAGSWGTVVAGLAARHVPTVLWARSPDLVATMQRERRNPRYCPGARLPDALRPTSDLDEVAEASVVVMAVPSHGFRDVLSALGPRLHDDVVVVSLTKGIEEGSLRRMTEVIADEVPEASAGVLTGPNLAGEVLAGQPTTSVVALSSEPDARRVQRVLHAGQFRVYTGTDVVGCEIAGATKNVLAIAAGMSDGLGFGENTRASLITRGLAELERLGVRLGGHRRTFAGLAGVGDLVATCTSRRSRNHTVGFELGSGRALGSLLASTPTVAEGVRTARPLVELARREGIEMPICEQVASIIDGQTSAADALRTLMDRPARAEWDAG